MSKSIFCHDENMLPHIQKILEGEYNINTKAKNPIILDIGANIGAFTIWVLVQKIKDWLLFITQSTYNNNCTNKQYFYHDFFIGAHRSGNFWV